jgi:hypothetical protein
MKNIHYEIGKIYKYPKDGKLYTLKSFTTDSTCHDDGQESCVICKGKMLFEWENKEQLISCPYAYDEKSKNWVPYFIKVKQ